MVTTLTALGSASAKRRLRRARFVLYCLAHTAGLRLRVDCFLIFFFLTLLTSHRDTRPCLHGLYEPRLDEEVYSTSVSRVSLYPPGQARPPPFRMCMRIRVSRPFMKRNMPRDHHPLAKDYTSLKAVTMLDEETGNHWHVLDAKGRVST